MNFLISLKTCFKKYIDFKGRASRSEFWYFLLFLVLSFFSMLLISNYWFTLDIILFCQFIFFVYF